MMNGASPLGPAERELILAYAAGVSGNSFVFTGHSEVAASHARKRVEHGYANLYRAFRKPETDRSTLDQG